MIQTLSLLGSTGSVGTQALDIVRNLGIQIKALAAYQNIECLEQQIREFRPEFAAIYDVALGKELKERVKDCPTRIGTGMEGLIEAATLPSAEMMFNSVVGMVGLCPTLEAIKTNKKIALANKETLVAGGALVMAEAKTWGSGLSGGQRAFRYFSVPAGQPGEKGAEEADFNRFRRPVFRKSLKELEQVTPEQALKSIPIGIWGRK